MIVVFLALVGFVGPAQCNTGLPRPKLQCGPHTATGCYGTFAGCFKKERQTLDCGGASFPQVPCLANRLVLGRVRHLFVQERPLRNLFTLTPNRDLSLNAIEVLPTNAFAAFVRLETLDLHGNHISEVQVGAFTALSALKRLYV